MGEISKIWSADDYKKARGETEKLMTSRFDLLEVSIQASPVTMGKVSEPLYQVTLTANTAKGKISQTGLVGESVLKDNIFVVHALDKDDALKRGGMTDMAKPSRYTTPEQNLIDSLRQNPMTKVNISMSRDDLDKLKSLGRYPSWADLQQKEEWRKQFSQIQKDIMIMRVEKGVGEKVDGALLQYGMKGGKNKEAMA